MMGKVKPKKPKKAGNLRARFVDEYMIDRNGSEAAKRAGYAPKSAGVTACQLLKNPKICEEISKRTAERSEKLGITADRVMQEYARLALLDPLDLFNTDGTIRPLSEMSEDARRAIAGLDLIQMKTTETDEVKVEALLKKIKLADKKGALDSLAKIMGLMKERVEVSGTINLAEELDKARRRLNG